VTLLMDRPQTSSALPAESAHEAVATGLLLDAVLGTNAGVRLRWLRNDAFGVTTVPPRQPATVEDVEIAEEIRALRDGIGALGVSRHQLARLLRVDRRSISGWVSGEIRPAPERVDTFRTVARALADMAADRPGRVPETLLARRDGVTLLDAAASGKTKLEGWRAWVSRGSTTVTVATRRREGEPMWGAAARAFEEGRLAVPTAQRTVRPASTYEMSPDEEAGAFAEPEYEVGRRGYR
jgi:DNA-binding transcriptional regulator YiaG